MFATGFYYRVDGTFRRNSVRLGSTRKLQSGEFETGRPVCLHHYLGLDILFEYMYKTESFDIQEEWNPEFYVHSVNADKLDKYFSESLRKFW